MCVVDLEFNRKVFLLTEVEFTLSNIGFALIEIELNLSKTM